ncbi:MAG: ATP-binding protein [Prevotella sp.]|jgi:AAA+ family protein|uniref:ATP-binding protein n=1 Tax=Prevotella sp. ICM33 TaxID=1161412 RepID=UPI000452EA53|nr:MULTISPECIES: ATP-binding protein [unclassified Prevotella]ETS96236.1 AAA domain protein [Prevotella sp. ICM33]MBF1619099.1 ATP-binding protein [Prevotella sp.]
MTDYIHRKIEETILEASKYFSVIAVSGPRQSGKSTLLTQLFPLYEKYSLKDLNILDYAKNDPIAFLNQTDEGMFIDEIQRCPQLLDYIQGIVDNNPKRHFALSGSSNFEVMKNLSESLAGRAGVFELLPMSIQEVTGKVDLDNLNQILYNGLYPSICAKKNIAKFFYPSYVRTYLEKDVRDLLQIKDQIRFTKFLKLCAARIGSLFNASELGAEVGVSSKTISHWLSVLQASYLITLLPPYYENIPKRLVKSPKLYFNDPGLACYLLDIESPQQLDRDKMRGAIFENMIVMEAIKHRYNMGLEGGVFFYRDSNQNEVDLLIKQGGELTAIEVKSSMTYSSSFEKALTQIEGWIKTPISKKAIVYSGDFENTSGNINLINYRHISSIL